MILVFHIFIDLFYKLYNCVKVRKINTFTLNLNSDAHPLAQRDAENDIKFDPPVYKQRYERAANILSNEKWKDQISKVVDFGCAEFGLFVFLKNEIQAREIVFVDIDELLMSDHLYRIYPLNADYLSGREKPLNVKVFAGSIANPDSSLLNTDAVVALEIIEHLYPDVLEAFPYNLFGYVCPKIVIVTTPNADFNVLFQKLDKFRHPDHKFEWTREQFESWATNIINRFPRYIVRFDGVGLGPTGSETYGCCSQLALFIRKDVICDNYVDDIVPCICENRTCEITQNYLCNCSDCLPKCSFGICTYYSCSQSSFEENSYRAIATVDYPYSVDSRTEDEKFLDEVKYRMHRFESRDYDFYNYDRNCVEIPLNRLVYRTSKPFPGESEVRTLLLKFNYQIEECLNKETNRLEACVVYQMESGGSGSDTEASGYESEKYNTDEQQSLERDEKSWDNPSDSEERVSNVKTQLHLEVDGKKEQGALFDSGYQKSPSVPDESPQSISGSNEANLSDFKPIRLSNILSVFDNFDKINEVDAVRKERKFFNFASNLPHREMMKKICQEIAKHPVAGPSRDPKKGKYPKKTLSSDSDDSVEDVKSITTCIIENSLNRIDFREDQPQRGDLIQELIPEEVAPEENPILEEVLVENGDLANNNRDLEGNNYAENPVLEIDNDIDNIEHNNVNIDNNNEIAGVPEEAPEEVVEENEIEPIDVEVAWSSREALFDANSQVDLLEDFEMDVAAINGVVYPNSCVLIDDSSSVVDEAVLPEEGGFPNWLLQIFEEGEAGEPEEDLHDEPHFYCQGDGLGVHPSVVAINDDADDEGNDSDSDSDSDSSSSTTSVDFASAENQSADMESNNSEENNLVLVGQALVEDPNNAEESPEVFENAEESVSNVVTSSCTNSNPR